MWLLAKRDNHVTALARDSHPAAALARDSRIAAALARDSRVWLLAKRDNHVELQVVVLPAAASRLLWEETVAAWIASRSRYQCELVLNARAKAVSLLPAKLELKGPAVYTMRHK